VSSCSNVTACGSLQFSPWWRRGDDCDELSIIANLPLAASGRLDAQLLVRDQTQLFQSTRQQHT
jgi:hypothetical protein